MPWKETVEFFAWFWTIVVLFGGPLAAAYWLIGRKGGQ